MWEGQEHLPKNLWGVGLLRVYPTMVSPSLSSLLLLFSLTYVNGFLPSRPSYHFQGKVKASTSENPFVTGIKVTEYNKRE